MLRGGGQPYSLNQNNIESHSKDSQEIQNLASGKDSQEIQNLASAQNTPKKSIPNQAVKILNSLLSKDSLLFQPIDTLTQELFNTNSCPYLPKLYGIYKSVDEIDFSKLPQSFVLKTNHDCGGVVLVKDKESFLKDSKSFNEAMDKLTKHLSTNYYHTSREWHYKDIEPRIFAEEMLGESVNGSIIDYKVHVVQNAISHIDVVTDRHTGQKEIAMDSKWHKMPFDYEKKATQIPQKPTMLDKMLDVSLLLAQAFKYVRVDLYCVEMNIYVGELTFTSASGKDKFTMLDKMLDVSLLLAQAFKYVRVDLYCVEMNIYVGELTFTSASGKDKFTPNEWDRKLGDLWDINTSLSRVES